MCGRLFVANLGSFLLGSEAKAVKNDLYDYITPTLRRISSQRSLGGSCESFAAEIQDREYSELFFKYFRRIHGHSQYGGSHHLNDDITYRIKSEQTCTLRRHPP